MNTCKGLASHPRCIIPSINPFLDQRDGSPPTGKTFWWDSNDAMGRVTEQPFCFDTSVHHLSMTTTQP